MGSYVSDMKLNKIICKAPSNFELTLWYFAFYNLFIVSFAIIDSRSSFAGFACPFGNVPGLGNSRKRYNYRSKVF